MSTKFKAGDKVQKIGGSYQAQGVIAAAWVEEDKGPRYVFRFLEPYGMLHIFGEAQLDFAEGEAPKDKAKKKRINSRAKGSAGEREFAKEVFERTGIELVRNLDQVRNGGHDLIVLRKDHDRHWPYAVEVKRWKKLTHPIFRKAWKQAVDQAEKVGKAPMLAYRCDQARWMIKVSDAGTYEIDDFFDRKFDGRKLSTEG